MGEMTKSRRVIQFLSNSFLVLCCIGTLWLTWYGWNHPGGCYDDLNYQLSITEHSFIAIGKFAFAFLIIYGTIGMVRLPWDAIDFDGD